MITNFENRVGDTLDQDYLLQLLNDAKDEVEGLEAWEILKNETSYTVSAGYSYTSALGALPTGFVWPVRVVESTSFIDYEKFDFDDRYSKANAPFGYFLDMANSNFYLTGQNHTAKTMYLYYIKSSTDITLTTSWSFPSRFHSIIPIKMAELYYLSDAGERGRSWDDKWSVQFERALNGMTAWNEKLKMANRKPRRMTRALSPKSVDTY